jgi:hypothetical protein
VVIVAEAVAEAAAAVTNTGSIKPPWLDNQKGSPCNCMQGLFL